MTIPTHRLQSPAFDCCLIIRWRSDHPDRVLPDLPRAYAERLLEDMVTTLAPHVRELQVAQQLPNGDPGLPLRTWSAAPEGAPPHSQAWFEATARTFNPPTPEEGITP
jgi:hypothetical protein